MKLSDFCKPKELIRWKKSEITKRLWLERSKPKINLRFVRKKLQLFLKKAPNYVCVRGRLIMFRVFKNGKFKGLKYLFWIFFLSCGHRKNSNSTGSELNDMKKEGRKRITHKAKVGIRR